jgi:hypothetical protein
LDKRLVMSYGNSNYSYGSGQYAGGFGGNGFGGGSFGGGGLGGSGGGFNGGPQQLISTSLWRCSHCAAAINEFSGDSVTYQCKY